MKKGAGRTALIILIISFILQIIPNVIYINKKFPFHSHNQLLPKNLYISNHIINKRHENYSNPKNSLRVSNLNNNIIMFSDYSITKPLQNDKPFDHRKSIRQTIPNFFHGSNNKHPYIQS
ncbi:hypothetical protein L323_03805 [Ruminiclostridium papyrosolvens C7]|uniref:Uncharacterized protein n=1 Tax=Ruminiclostridium papyrosolvens C7 TaxID=1330534 RepID=U4R4Y0_9FIRM|nr:hypothetical protein L323_03805 [Ruminiclostridium papyrosolvens C7]